MTASPPKSLRLTRRDPARNMARFHVLALEPTLFGEITLVRNRGRIGTRGRTSLETGATSSEAETAAGRTLRQKVRRGYRAA